MCVSHIFTLSHSGKFETGGKVQLAGTGTAILIGYWDHEFLERQACRGRNCSRICPRMRRRYRDCCRRPGCRWSRRPGTKDPCGRIRNLWRTSPSSPCSTSVLHVQDDRQGRAGNQLMVHLAIRTSGSHGVVRNLNWQPGTCGISGSCACHLEGDRNG